MQFKRDQNRWRDHYPRRIETIFRFIIDSRIVQY